MPFDFAAPDLGAAVARMMRGSLPEVATSAEDDGGLSGFEPGKKSEEKNMFGVSAPRATAATRVLGLRRPLQFATSPLLPPPLRGRGQTESARRHCRRCPLPPPLSREAAAALPAFSSFSASACAPSPFFRHLRVL